MGIKLRTHVDLLANNGGFFTAKLLQAVCHMLSIWNIFTTAYHLQSNRQFKRYNHTTINALICYISYHPKYLDPYNRPLMFAYNFQPHTSTYISPFELIISNPPGPIAIQKEPSARRTPSHFKAGWKTWLNKSL